MVRAVATAWRTWTTPFELPLSVDAVHGDAAEELRIEVGGFLGHYFTRSGDAHDLSDADGIEEKCDLSGAAINRLESRESLAFIGKIAFGGNRLERDAESRFENAIMKKDNIKLALKRRNSVKQLRQVCALAQDENVIGALTWLGSGVDADDSLSGRVMESVKKSGSCFGLLSFV